MRRERATAPRGSSWRQRARRHASIWRVLTLVLAGWLATAVAADPGVSGDANQAAELSGRARGVAPLPHADELSPERIASGSAEDPVELQRQVEAFQAAGDYAQMLLAALDLRDAAESNDRRLFALRSIGRAYGILGDREQALSFLEQAVRLVDQTLPPEAVAEVYRDAAGMLGELGRHERAVELLESALADLGTELDGEPLGYLYVMLGANLAMGGEVDRAIAELDRAERYPIESRRGRFMLRNNRGMLHKLKERYGDALLEFETLLAEGQEREEEQAIVYALLELGDIHRIIGELAEARAYLEEALDRSIAAEQAAWARFGHAYLAALDDAEGNAAAAQAHRDESARLEEVLRTEAVESRAELLEVTVEVMERGNRIALLQMEKELQAVELDRSRKLFWFSILAALLLAAALWFALQQARTRAAANRTLDRLANTDVLTGLYNRRYLIGRAEEVLSSRMTIGDTAALIVIDLDRFKRINDRHGHEHGDAVLVEVARRLSEVVRSDDALARWGGEEFLAFLPACPLPRAEEIGERMRQAITTEAIVFDGVEHAVTATVGVTAVAVGGDFDEAFQRADAALYAGKQAGRDRVEVAPPEG